MWSLWSRRSTDCKCQNTNKRTVVIGKRGGVKDTVLRRVFGYMGEEVSRDWRNLHKETYLKLCS
jgi:hypothetical protein